jgi:hypothetical protein
MAASPLLERCRDRYGFVVMRDGLPKEPAVLGRVLLELSRGLSVLDAEMGAPRIYPTFGVYFGRRQLAWFEDGYSGTTGLAVPNKTNAADLAAFVRPRIAVALAALSWRGSGYFTPVEKTCARSDSHGWDSCNASPAATPSISTRTMAAASHAPDGVRGSSVRRRSIFSSMLTTSSIGWMPRSMSARRWSADASICF